LHADLQGACLLYLDTRSLLRWAAVSRGSFSTGSSSNRNFNGIFASQGHAQRHIQRLLLELHHSKDHLHHVSQLAGHSIKPAPPAWATAAGATATPPKRVLNIGHKGAEGHVKGNTLDSFHRAVELGVDMIEFDVVACADGILCHHDPLHEASGKWYQDMTIAKVRSLLGRPHPTLDEMLADRRLRDSGVHLYFDLKHTNIVRPTMRSIVAAVTRGGWHASRFVVATFKQVELLEINAFRQAIPELRGLRTAAILDAIPLSLARDFEALGCCAVSVGQYCVCPEFVADCHRRGLEMWAWTVNHKSMVDELFRLGIDGICTDYPELVHAAAAARAAAIPAAAAATPPHPAG
ncbi:PLC-like phosphodiesterase, partial [Tribonema minus]